MTIAVAYLCFKTEEQAALGEMSRLGAAVASSDGIMHHMHEHK